MSMIPSLEQSFGTYFPEGGMHQITKSLEKLAKDIGIQFHFNTKVDEIITKRSKVVGIKTGKSFIPSDIVISNADIVPTYTKLLPKKRLEKNPFTRKK